MKDGSRHFLRLPVVPTDTTSWSVRLAQEIAQRIKRGDRLVFREWFRSPESLVLHFYVEESEKQHAKTVSSQLFLTPEQREHRVVGTANRDYAAGEAGVILFFGTVPGNVDIADFRLYNVDAGSPAVP